MQRIKVSMKTKTNKQAEQTIKNLKDGYVKIGWFEGKKEPNGLLVAENAYMQENGFRIKHRNGKETYVPPRPFLSITMSKNSSKWQSIWKKAYKTILEGKNSLILALNVLGTKVKTDIQDTIKSSDGIRPNAPSTIESKKRRNRPLIPLMDSMAMFKTINYKSTVGKGK